MPPRTPEIPHYRERVALQALRDGQWIEANHLHSAAPMTLDKMAAKGWIEKDGINGLYRITDKGLAALIRQIPVD